jgi:predicted phosphohydrolase
MESDSWLKKNITSKLSKVVLNVSTFFQPIWFRHSTVLVDTIDWESLVCQHRIVLLGGCIFWAIHLLSQ